MFNGHKFISVFVDVLIKTRSAMLIFLLIFVIYQLHTIISYFEGYKNLGTCFPLNDKIKEKLLTMVVPLVGFTNSFLDHFYQCFNFLQYVFSVSANYPIIVMFFSRYYIANEREVKQQSNPVFLSFTHFFHQQLFHHYRDILSNHSMSTVSSISILPDRFQLFTNL